MKRLAVEQEVALSVGDATVDCRVAALSGGEAALAPLDPGDSGVLPAASAGASLVFTHGGRLVMLRGAMYRAGGDADLRFAEKSGGSGPVVAEQRRKAARLPITLPATIRQLRRRSARRSARSASSSRATSASAASRSGRASAGSPPAPTSSSSSS